MAGPIRRRGRPLLALVAALGLALAAGAPPAPVGAASSWTGGIDLYRSGAFSTQASWLWCTAADVQIIRNLVRGEADHSSSRQREYFGYMRAHNRYDIPVSDGVDPAGWTAGLRHYVDARYRLVQSGSFDAALRSAVRSLRTTHRPVGLLVAHGNHAWVLTGFTATADPAVTSDFTVTSVRVTGPLWGLQSRSYGYDMRPDTKLTPKQLAGFWTRWHYGGVRMAWEGRYVSIQAVQAAAAKAAPALPASPAALRPRPTPTAPPTTPAPSVPDPSARPTPREVAVAGAESPRTLASAPASRGAAEAGDLADASRSMSVAADPLVVLGPAVLVLVLGSGVLLAVRRRRT